MLLSLDAEKAFDRVDWKYLEHTLGKKKFHPDFTSWIGVLYSGPMSKVRVNGYTSRTFGLKRGTRQVCPLSPLVFVITGGFHRGRKRRVTAAPRFCSVLNSHRARNGRGARDPAIIRNISETARYRDKLCIKETTNRLLCFSDVEEPVDLTIYPLLFCFYHVKSKIQNSPIRR